MPYALVIFDLDGTLADSFPWFLRTINDVADRFGFRRVANEDVEALRHASTREILSRLEVPVWKLPAIARHARRLKGEAAAEISLFAGVEPDTTRPMSPNAGWQTRPTERFGMKPFLDQRFS